MPFTSMRRGKWKLYYFHADQRFELVYATSPKNKPTFSGRVRTGKDGRHAVETVLAPPEEPVEQMTRPKQLLFVVDTSGSMRQEDKLAQARRAVLACVEQLQRISWQNS